MTRVALISFLTNNLSIRLLSAYLKKNGFETICIFCPTDLNKINVEIVINILSKNNISLVGITLVTDDYYKAVTLTKAIKQCLGISVIWGGAHPSIMPEECLRHADMVCVGEGEEALLELVQTVNCNVKPPVSIKNIYFKVNNEIVRNELRNLEEDLDKYPFPDFELSTQFFITEKSFEIITEKHLEGIYSIMTSRGCPYSCCYCYNSYRRRQYKDKGRYLRLRSIDNVFDELKRVKGMFKNLRFIHFWDDTFLSRSYSDFDKFRNLYPRFVNLPFFVLAEPMAFDNAKIKILADCGLVSIQLGIQSGSEKLNRDFYHRPVLNKHIIEMAVAINKLGILPTYDFIFNNPYESKEDLRKTIDLLLNLPKPFQLQGYNLIFYPGSEITRKALADGFIVTKPERIDDFSSIQSEKNSPVVVRNKSIDSSRFYSLRYDSKEKSYLNSLIILASFPRVPKTVIGFFKKSETGFKQFLLNCFLDIYLTLSRLKNSKLSVGNE